jgi:phage/plasmid-associated DNA primase
MEVIRNLVSEKFNLFNVSINKIPVGKNGKAMEAWEKMSYDDLVKQHNYKSKLWGMKMGEQPNGRHILSLDFDVYDKNANGDCTETKKRLDEYLSNCINENGMYSSSTFSNMNVLVDYTNSPVIKSYVEKTPTTKFTEYGLEILLKGNQVIPPSQTICKKLKKLGDPRTFKTNQIFYVIENEECFTFQFIKRLFENKFKKTSMKTIKCKPVSNDEPTTDNESVDEEPNTNKISFDDKYLDLLFNVIKNEKDKNGKNKVKWDYWFQIAGILKYNNYDKSVFINYSDIFGKSPKTSELWDGIRNPNKTMSIYGLQNIAKDINPDGYEAWLKKYDIYKISSTDVNDPYKCANVISKTLKETLVLCNENWYMLTESQLWKKQKEPSYYIVSEIHKYLDRTTDILNNQIQKATGDEKQTLVDKLDDWLKVYSKVSTSSYLSVLTKFLRKLLADDNFTDILDANKGKLAFKNGIVDLETKKFRKGILWSDFITQTIPYDYKPSGYDYLKPVLKKILNNNDEHLEYFLSLIGYSFIGQADLEKSIYFMIDKTEGGKGDNGKTFFFDILNDLMPNYVYRSKASLIESNNSKVHKQLVMTKGKRLVWLEELPKEKNTNAELMKEIGDGKKLENEVMFGTSETISIMFKMFALSNHIPKIDPNESAVYNRYKQVSFNSHFDRTGSRTEENPEELKFVAVSTLPDKIKEQYYDEVFNLIIDYASKYYQRKLPSIPQQFVADTKETQSMNDEFSSWFDENCERCEGENVALKKLISQSDMNEKLVKEGMTRKGFRYDKDLRGLGKDLYGKHYKGGYRNIKIIEENGPDDEMDNTEI